MNHLDTLGQILGITAPVFAMVLMGLLLKKISLINDSFIQTASTLTYKATMPTLFFLSIWRADLQSAFNLQLVLYFCVATLVGFAASWWWASRTVEYRQRGVFVQGAFRGNCGVVSFALVASTYGDYGLSVGGVLAGFTILLFNVLSVLILSLYSPSLRFSPVAIARELAKNPLIIAVVLGMFASAMGLSLPQWLLKSAEYFAGLTLPLALICVGGTLSLAGIRASGSSAMQSSFIKVLGLPVLACAGAWLLGITGTNLVILWMFFASPTAAASFAMAVAAGGDGRLAANIIALTTLVSIASITLGIYALKAMGH
ncbi:AEC family transporter [Limnobacter sp.]|uniref:AEC family transporter n=1 Tax=Limnobacter sp. TaxID=2003368 RepID=UPI003512F8D3